MRGRLVARAAPALSGLLTPSGAVTLTNGQTVSGLVIYASGTAITGSGVDNVTIRNCLIFYNQGYNAGEARGIKLTNCDNVLIEDVEGKNVGAPHRGALSSTSQNCIYLENCASPTINRVTTRQGSTGISLVSCSDTTITFHENHDSRGPYPRGQAIQWNSCTGTHTATNVSDESIPGTSWNEDSYNIYATPNVTISGIFIPMQSDGLSGRGLVLEQVSTTNCLVTGLEALYTFNGLAGGFECGTGNEIQGKAKYYDRYSARALPGSSNSGNTLPALAVTGYNPTPGQYTDLDFLFYGIPARAPNGTTMDAGKRNTWYNPTDIGGIAQGTGTVTEQDWTVTRAPVRNVFPWRSVTEKPRPDLQPRLNSYWLDGRIATAIIPGTSILVALPGRYHHDPTSRVWQWYKDGSPISGKTGIDYDVASGDALSLIQWSEEAANDNGSYFWMSEPIRIPA